MCFSIFPLHTQFSFHRHVSHFQTPRLLQSLFCNSVIISFGLSKLGTGSQGSSSSFNPEPAPAAPKPRCWFPNPAPLKRPHTRDMVRDCSFLPLHKCQNVWALGAGRGRKMGGGKQRLACCSYPSPGGCYLSPERYLLLQTESNL